MYVDKSPMKGDVLLDSNGESLNHIEHDLEDQVVDTELEMLPPLQNGEKEQTEVPLSDPIVAPRVSEPVPQNAFKNRRIIDELPQTPKRPQKGSVIDRLVNFKAFKQACLFQHIQNGDFIRFIGHFDDWNRNLRRTSLV